MRPKTPEQVCALLIQKGGHPGLVFYDGSDDCRNLRADLIRGALPLLRKNRWADKEVRTLVGAVRTDESDALVEKSWREAIDALRALCGTSPTGTRREREILLGIARNDKLVDAMVAAASGEPDIDPSWLAVFSARGSPESRAIVRRESPSLADYPDLAAGIASYEGTLRSTPAASPSVERSDHRLPIRIGNGRFTNTHFWTLIDAASLAVDPLGTLSQWLQALKPHQLAAFDRHFAGAMDRAYRHELWGAAFLLLEGCSDDCFSDFRAELILRGKQVFERVLQDPDALAEHTDVQGDEAIAGLAAVIYEEKTGRELASRRGKPRRPEGESLDFDDKNQMRQRYPRLAAWQRSRPRRT